MPEDLIITSVYLRICSGMLAAESLGLGTCFNGAVHPFIQNGKAARLFREKYGIKHKSREGIFLLIGYPKVKYTSSIKRTFASIDRI